MLDATTPILPPTILVVEDNPDDAMVVGLTFERAGIANPLQFVEDGQEAWDYLDGHGKFADREAYPLPVLIILDINLPKLDGFQVLAATEALRKEHRISVVVLSVTDREADLARAQHLGATKLVRKPIDPQKLLQVVSEIPRFQLLLVPRS